MSILIISSLFFIYCSICAKNLFTISCFVKNLILHYKSLYLGDILMNKRECIDHTILLFFYIF